MSTLPAVTMQELELEQAELLPSRETLTAAGTPGHSPRGQLLSGDSFNQVANGIGNRTRPGS